MNRKILLGVSLLCILVFAAASAFAASRTEKFSLNGTGSFMAHPPTFTGLITGGTMYPGTFLIVFDDTGWPTDDPGTPQNERFDYIMAHYFHYHATPGSECWDGYFPTTDPRDPEVEWRFYTAAGDTVGGNYSQITITVKDLNANGIMEESEYANKVISGNMVSWIDYSRGCFRTFCGTTGSFPGTLKVVNAVTMEEEWSVPSPSLPGGRLYLKDTGCAMGVEPSSWGSIKSIYR